MNLDQPRYVQSTFSLTFNRVETIRRMANEIEDYLVKQFDGHYGAPQVIPVPDDLDPEVPRLVFGSKHGFSQIALSQIGLNITVSYSPDWQVDAEKRKKYLAERIDGLFEILNIIGLKNIFYAGIQNKLQLYSRLSEEDLLGGVSKLVAVDQQGEIFDVVSKCVTVVEEKFFQNTTIQIFRQWPTDSLSRGPVPRLSRKDSIGCGVEIISDFNDRYAFHENPEYQSSKEIATKVIELGYASSEEAASSIIRALG